MEETKPGTRHSIKSRITVRPMEETKPGTRHSIKSRITVRPMEETKPGTRHSFTQISKTISQSRNPDHSPTDGTRAKTSFFFSPANDLRK